MTFFISECSASLQLEGEFLLLGGIWYLSLLLCQIVQLIN